MPDDSILSLDIKGLDVIARNLSKLNGDLESMNADAGAEIAKMILKTQGLQKYPGATAANQPPTPYYIRGKGMQYKTRNNGKSERLGTKFTVKSGGYKTIIGNDASYAPYVIGQDQAAHMARIGWRKLFDVAREKVGDITKIYQAFVDRLIRKNGLS